MRENRWEAAEIAGDFTGWYLKCQSKEQTLAVIPAVHGAGKERTCSIQVIGQEGAWTAELPGTDFRWESRRCLLGKSAFGPEGFHLEVKAPGLSAYGDVAFGTLTPLPYDIMGPFALVPWMECRHWVGSMRHRVDGRVTVNGREYRFNDGAGYWEGDRGRSFPKTYAWTQCSFPEGSLMAAVADIPLAGFHFTGVLGAVLWQGRQYRLATYLGARAEIGDRTIRIRQRDLTLEAQMLADAGHSLRAPSGGKMVRTIHEATCCPARYRFSRNGRTLFEFQTTQASFEYEYP